MHRLFIESGPTQRRLTPPVSKSDAIRSAVIQHIISGPFQLERELPVDVEIVIAALQRLGASEETISLHMGLGGAPLRFITGIAAATPGRQILIDAAPQLQSRPHKPLFTSLSEGLLNSGVRISYKSWPLRIDTRRAEYAPVVEFEVEGSSSQYASALLLCGAALVGRGLSRQVDIEVSGRLASRAYLDLTCGWLGDAGFSLKADGNRWCIEGFEPARPMRTVPLDWSSAAYLMIFAWKQGGTVAISPDSRHADRIILELLTKAGLSVQMSNEELSVAGELTGGFDWDVSQAPDTAPVLSVLALVAPGPSRFRRAGILRHKESDRLEFILDLARQTGADADLNNDTLTIDPRKVEPDSPVVITSAHDHRRVLASACLLALGWSEIHCDDIKCVTKSFPGFWQQLAGRGVGQEVIDA